LEKTENNVNHETIKQIEKIEQNMQENKTKISELEYTIRDEYINICQLPIIYYMNFYTV